MIRITQSMQIARALLDQNMNLERMNEYSNHMSSRTTLHRPSDDPIKVARSMRFITELNVNETYKYELQSAESWTSKTDVSLNTLSDIIKRVRELTVQASSGEKTQEDKQKIQQEIDELKQAAIQIGNDDYMGRYQFSGHKTNKKFLTKDGKYNTELDLAGLNYEKIDYNIGVGQKTRINITGVEVFGNEDFTTKTRALGNIPFTDEASSLLGANMTIRLQKYKKPDKHYDVQAKNTSEEMKKEQEKKYEIEEKYEKTTQLDDKDGNEIVLRNISFYGNYKKDDINSIIEDLNKSLRNNIDKVFVADKAKAEELKKSVQFVNEDGKISLVTDKDYAGKIEAEKLNIKDIKLDTKKTSTTTPSSNLEIQSSVIDYTSSPVKAFFDFDIRLTEYEKDENGYISRPKNPSIDLGGITLVNEYKKGNYSNEEIAKRISWDLQSKIQDRLKEKKLPQDIIKVVVENNRPTIIVNKDYGVRVSDNTSRIESINVDINGIEKEPNKDPKKNAPQTIDLEIDLNNKVAGKDALVNLSFDLDIKKYKRHSFASGDYLISKLEAQENGNNAGNGGNPGVQPEKIKGHLIKDDPKNPPQNIDMENISITKLYSGKNKDGTDKSNEALLKEIANDLQIQINNKAMSSNPPLESSAVKVEIQNGKLKLVIDGNLGTKITGTTRNIQKNKFPDVQSEAGTNVVKSEINIAIPQPSIVGNTDVYMDLNIDINPFGKDEKGNPDINKKLGTINIEGIKLNKSYPRQKADGTNYTDDEIKKQIFDDVKKQIEDRLSKLNPPLEKKQLNIKKDGDNNIKILVYPDIEVSISSNMQKPSSLTSDVNYIPNENGDIKPKREMMPFFEMMDRLSKLMNQGDSKGISRMLDVVDYHAKNLQKNQGIVGAKTNMYKTMLERTQDIKLNYSKVLSETRDTDYNEVSMQMMVAQYVYRASLSVTAKIIQPSLVDFLR